MWILYVGMMIHDFPGLLFWMIFLDWVLRMIILDWFFLDDDDDDWNHLTKTPYTTARKGRKKNFFLTHFCVLLMLLESELHFIVLHLDFAFVPLSITVPDLYPKSS
jgi:hypothetical protein